MTKQEEDLFGGLSILKMFLVNYENRTKCQDSLVQTHTPWRCFRNQDVPWENQEQIGNPDK